MSIESKNQILTAHFEADHDRLDSLLDNFLSLKSSDFAEAKPFFKTFLQGLKRHIIWEEDILFPFFESKTGHAETGPTAVMRHEHRQIEAALEVLHNKVRRADPACESEVETLKQILQNHNQKEEQVLYPALDSLLDEKEKAEVFRAMETVPVERYQTCCGGIH